MVVTPLSGILLLIKNENAEMHRNRKITTSKKITAVNNKLIYKLTPSFLYKQILYKYKYKHSNKADISDDLIKFVFSLGL